VVKRRNNASGIHILKTDNGVIEDSKLIKGHVLDFYRNLYAESNCNGPTTGSMEEFIGSYIPEIVSSKENIMLTKCPYYLEIKNAVFNLNGNGAPGSDSFGGFFYQSCWDIIGMDVCKVVQQFFKQIWILFGMNNNVVSLIPKTPGADSVKISDQLFSLISNLRSSPKYWRIGLLLWLLESFIQINMGWCRVDRFMIVLVFLLKLLTCFLKRLKEVMWLTKLIFIKHLTL